MNMDTSIHRDEVFAENRDELFLNRLLADVKKLKSIGLEDNAIKKIVGTFNYVRVYVNTPIWLYPILKLPQGYSWRNDGLKYKCSEGTYYLLPIGRDLYIKGIDIPGTHISDSKIGYIKNYRKLKGKDVQVFGPMLNSILLNFWHDNELPLGFIEPITRNLSDVIVSSVLKEYRQLNC